MTTREWLDRELIAGALQLVGRENLKAFLEVRRLGLTDLRDIKARCAARDADWGVVEALFGRVHLDAPDPSAAARAIGLRRTIEESASQVGAAALLEVALPVGGEIPLTEGETVGPQHLFRRALRALGDDLEN